MGAPGSATNPRISKTKAPPESLNKNKSRSDTDKNWRAKLAEPKRSTVAKNQVRFSKPVVSEEVDAESDSESENEGGPASLEVIPPDSVSSSDFSSSISPRPSHSFSVSPSISRPMNNTIPNRSTPKELPFKAVPAVNLVPAAQPAKLVEKVTQKRDATPSTEKRVPAYKTRAPVEQEGQAARIAEKMMRQIVALETEELLGVSPGLQKEVMKYLAKKKISQVVQTLQCDMEGAVDEALGSPQMLTRDRGDTELEVPTPVETVESLYVAEEPDAINIESLPVAVLLFDASWEEGGKCTGPVVMSDPYLQYLEALPPGEMPKQVIMAKDSQSLRVVFPVINGKKELEAVSDSGSQIVSMAETVALDLGLAWDPDITIHMQSANKQLEKTLGLARNVPFRFDDLTVYLQVHILRNPAYKVLLGRPFDVLTESEVKNKPDGGQSITIKCPNTGKRLVVPTFTRGLPPLITKHLDGEDFR